ARVGVRGVAGLDEGDARQGLEAVNLQAAIEEPQPSDDVEEGLFLSSDPSVGESVEEGSAVRLVFSSGPEDVDVPDMIGMTSDQARTALEQAGLTLGGEESGEDPDREPGTVMATDPSAGSTVPPGTAVTLTIVSNLVELPDLTGM